MRRDAESREETLYRVGAGRRQSRRSAEGTQYQSVLLVSVQCPGPSLKTATGPLTPSPNTGDPAICSRWVEAWPGSSESQGSTFQGRRPAPLGWGTKVWGAWIPFILCAPSAQAGFHQGSQAGTQACEPQSLLSHCSQGEENDFQLNYPSHSNIITLR